MEITSLIELFQFLGVNWLYVFSIVGVSEAIKKLDPEEKLKRFYVLIPLVLSLVVGLFQVDHFSLGTFSELTFTYFGVSSLMYSILVKQIRKFTESDTTKAASKEERARNLGADK